MAIGGAFLGGGVELVPAGSCKLELEILTEDRANLAATFTIKGTSTYTVTAGADGRAVYTVPAGQTYTVSVNTTGYDNIASQTVIAESGTVRYVRFEAFSGRVKRSGDTMTGNLTVEKSWAPIMTLRVMSASLTNPASSVRDLGYTFEDSSGYQIGSLYERIATNGDLYLALQTKSNKSGSEKRSTITIYNNADGSADATVPSWSIGTNDNSDKIMSIKMANSLPSLVHTTGNENISGNKTFTSLLTRVGTDPWFIVQNLKFTDGTLPSAECGWDIQFTDKNNAQMGGIRHSQNTTGRGNTYLFARNYNSSTVATLQLIVDADGKSYGLAPTTPTNASGNEIATADWSIGKFVQKSGDTMTGTLTVHGNPFGIINRSLIKQDEVVSGWTRIYQDEVIDSDGKSLGYSQRFRSVADNGSNYDKMSIGVYAKGGAKTSTIGVVCPENGDGYADAPSWSPGTNDNSDKILTIKMANSLPSLVHTTGNETIAGWKIFTTNPTIRADNMEAGLGLMRDKAVGDIDGWTRNALIGFFWKDYVYNGFITTTRDPTNSALEITASNGSGTNTSILIIQPNNGSPGWATAPATPSNATSNEIATANWSLSKFQRKITYGTGDPPSGGQAGDIYIKI